MARFDVRRLKSRGPISLVIELQSDHMRELSTVIVAPLIAVKRLRPYELINPLLDVRGERMAIRLEQMAGVPAASLGETVASAPHTEAAVSVALQRLLFYV